MRQAGALMPVASLPSKFGVGDFGPNTFEFIDILIQMKLKIWQVLPLNPLGFGNSPYQAYSSFAGDELYISLEKLIDDGLLDAEDLILFNENSSKIDYQAVRRHKEPLLYKSFQNFKASVDLKPDYANFVSSTTWLLNYCVFLTFKKANDLKPWIMWPDEHRLWINNKHLNLDKYQEQIDYEKFIQFIFYRQWHQLKAYANDKGISIMGDLPIYLGLDSLDVWENQDMFLLDENHHPSHVAGVPPDYFSVTGQRWGNPIYNWAALKETGFKFWINRLDGNSTTFDIIRIDHFRAFDTYWKIPSSCETAIEGEWVEAPGYELFDSVYKALPGIHIVAEDLGDLRNEVLVLRDHFNLKGMKVFQFIFDENSNNEELHNTVNTIIYTGTHDNSTLMGWYNTLSEERKMAINEFFNVDSAMIRGKIISYVLNSQAEIAIFPMQDILGLDDSARINTPGVVGSPNWEWKLIDFEKFQSKTDFIQTEVINSKRT